MKAEIKFANTSNGPKAFVKTFDDDWTPMSTPLKAYKKDMRSIKPAGNYEEGKDYMVAVSPWVLEAFLKANQIDYVQLIRGQDLKNPPVGSIRYANEKEVVWYEYSSATTTRRCTDLSRAKSFVQEWVNLDCPTLKRFSTNQKVLSVNGFGAAVPLFESPLVDTSYVDTVIADDIEDKEIEGLRKHLNPDGVISQLLNNVQNRRLTRTCCTVQNHKFLQFLRLSTDNRTNSPFNFCSLFFRVNCGHQLIPCIRGPFFKRIVQPLTCVVFFVRRCIGEYKFLIKHVERVSHLLLTVFMP